MHSCKSFVKRVTETVFKLRVIAVAIRECVTSSQYDSFFSTNYDINK